MEEITRVSRRQFGARLQFLNRTIKEVRAEVNKNPGNLLMNQKVKELYALKRKILLKMLSEGHVSVGNVRITGRSYYIFSICNEFSFHLPITNDVKRAVKKYGRRRKYAKNE